jgi:hypothetical protein
VNESAPAPIVIAAIGSASENWWTFTGLEWSRASGEFLPEKDGGTKFEGDFRIMADKPLTLHCNLSQVHWKEPE